MTAGGKVGAVAAREGASSSGGVAQPFLAFDPAELVAVRVLPAEFARLTGVSKQAVSGWIKRGLVTLGPDGRLDPSKAYRQLMANGDPGRLRARFLKGAMDDVGQLKRDLAEARKRLAALEAARAHVVHADDVEERLARLLDAIAERLPALAEAGARGQGALALDWLAGLAFRGLSAAELADAFGDDAESLRAALGDGAAGAGVGEAEGLPEGR